MSLLCVLCRLSTGFITPLPKSNVIRRCFPACLLSQAFIYTTMSKTIYFGYGSNLWLDQMKRRCPESKFIGIGRLDHWKWIINVRGYANIIPSHGDVVYGLVYELTGADEHDLDLYEGSAYAKKILPVLLTETKSEYAPDIVEMLIYIDDLRKSESHPRKEYIYRMNMGIADALEQGVPQDYIDKYLRPFIPSPDNAVLVNEC